MNQTLGDSEEIYILNHFVRGSETMLLGFSVPQVKSQEFLEILNKAAKSVGAIPIHDFNPLDNTVPSESEVMRYWLDEKDQVIQEASELLNDNSN